MSRCSYFLWCFLGGWFGVSALSLVGLPLPRWRGGFLARLRLVVALCSLAFWSSAPWMVAFWRVCVCCPLGPALPVARQPPGSRLLVFGSVCVLPPAYRRDDLNCSCIASSFSLLTEIFRADLFVLSERLQCLISTYDQKRIQVAVQL